MKIWYQWWMYLLATNNPYRDANLHWNEVIRGCCWSELSSWDTHIPNFLTIFKSSVDILCTEADELSKCVESERTFSASAYPLHLVCSFPLFYRFPLRISMVISPFLKEVHRFFTVLSARAFIPNNLINVLMIIPESQQPAKHSLQNCNDP